MVVAEDDLGNCNPCNFKVGDARVGDTIIEAGTEDEVEALPGYTEASQGGSDRTSASGHFSVFLRMALVQP